jgi:ribosomal protein S27E
MLLRCKCPDCGDLKEYVAEQVGTEADCLKCGHRFTLQPNKGRSAWQIISATLAVLLMIGGVSARYYLRAQRADARREAFQRRHEQLHPTAPAADRDDQTLEPADAAP